MKNRLSGGLVHEIPADFFKALIESQKIIDLWEALTPIARNEFLCWVEDAKRANTRAKRIERAIGELLEGKKRPCCWPGCIHRNDKKPGKWQQAVLIEKNLICKSYLVWRLSAKVASWWIQKLVLKWVYVQRLRERNCKQHGSETNPSLGYE